MTSTTRAMGTSCGLSASRDYFLLRRWTRVLRSSLRCFFLAIRLRRFLTTEPTVISSYGLNSRGKDAADRLS